MLDPSQSALLGALTLTALTHLGDDTGVMDADGQLKKCRMMRVGDVALVDLPADDSGPRCINCYAVEVEPFAAIDGHKFKIDPSRLVYSLLWRPNGEQPSLELVLIQDEPAGWVNTANLTLLSVLRQQAPDAIDWGPLFAAGVVDMLDDFEAARANHSTANGLSGSARRH